MLDNEAHLERVAAILAEHMKKELRTGSRAMDMLQVRMAGALLGGVHNPYCGDLDCKGGDECWPPSPCECASDAVSCGGCS